MKLKQTHPLFSLEATQILQEILRYLRFLALNKEQSEKQKEHETNNILQGIGILLRIVGSEVRQEEK